jgi:hypothetical protein
VSTGDRSAVAGADVAASAGNESGATGVDDETIGGPLFGTPSTEEAAFILRSLTWGEHYIATEMNSASGNRQVYLYSLEEAARFFTSEVAGSRERRGRICWVDRGAFIAWIAAVVKDTELAAVLTEALADQTTDFDKTLALYTLINTRVEQLKGLVAP